MLKAAMAPSEIAGSAVLEWYSGAGAVRVLVRDADAVLLERAAGPTELADLARRAGDEAALRILCDTARRLHGPAGRLPEGIIPLDPWFAAVCSAGKAAAGATGSVFVHAAATLDGLLASAPEPIALHGDLHHGNVLDGGARARVVAA